MDRTERDWGFNFKLLVPPRVNAGQVSAVRPHEIVENCDDFPNPLQQDYGKGFDNEQNGRFPNTSVVAPTKPTRQDFPRMKAVPPLEKDENNISPGQLYSKLYDEVEKIKSWKVKLDSGAVQNEKRLQENKRTIETQRKAIQELQFGNESLSIKLEEQMSENEDLRNKNSATRNLCQILKDTFDRSAEKMHLFESEREETHHIFMQNSQKIQKLIAAFESLRVQVETDQQELQKVKGDLLHYEELKNKCQQECNIKEEEVAGLQTTLKNKEDELQKVLLDLCESKQQCKQLQEALNLQYELFKCSKAEQETLFKKLQTAEQCCKENEKTCEALTAAQEQSREEYAQIIQSKDLSLQELNRDKSQQAEKLEQMETTCHELQNLLELKTQRVKDLEENVMATSDEMERTKLLLEETIEEDAKKDEKVKLLEDELVKMEELEAKLFTEMKSNRENTFQMEQLMDELTQLRVNYEELMSNFNELQSENYAIQQQFESGSSHVKAIEANLKDSEQMAVKLNGEFQRLEEENQSLKEEINSSKLEMQRKCNEIETLQMKIEENCEYLQEEITKKEKQIKALESKFFQVTKKIEVKLKAQEEFKKENKLLKKQIAKETGKSNQLESAINSLQEQFQNLKNSNKDNHQKLLKDLESKSTFAAELENEVHKLRSTTAEAIKNKEDAELKCQHKIADMVALMEKHKNQYDRMVEEKDAELKDSKNKQAEAVAFRTSLELDLSRHKTENDQLKKQLKKETTDKEILEREITDLKTQLSSLEITQLSEAKKKQSPDLNYKQGRSCKSPRETYSKMHVFDFSKSGKTPPHSKDDATAVKKKTDVYTEDLKIQRSATICVGGSSKIRSYRIRTPPSGGKAACWEKNTILLDPKSDSSDPNDLWVFANTPTPTVSAPHFNPNFKKLQSPVTHKSPGNSLKLAAMKRMRDAGWTAVTGITRKKKKANEKIFA